MPEFVVFFGPSFVDITGTHGAVGAFHADRANVDVSNEHSHHQHSCHRVDHVGYLHGATFINQSRDDLV